LTGLLAQLDKQVEEMHAANSGIAKPQSLCKVDETTNKDDRYLVPETPLPQEQP